MMDKKTTRCYLAVFILLAALIFNSGNGFAAQGMTPSGPIGGTDLNQALNPPPGLYVGLIYGYIDFKDWYFDDDTAHKISDNQQFEAIGFSYAYETKIFGGSLLSTFVIGYQDFTFGYNEQNTFYDAHGMMDIYSDVFYWSRFFPDEEFMNQPKGSMIPYGLAVGAGLGMTLPTGSYSDSDMYNVGSNFFTISPSFSLTWTIPGILGKTLGDATQFSGRVFYNYYTENRDADFQNGSIISMDYAITQIKGNFQYGIAGNAYTQVTDDDLTGPKSSMRTKNKAKSIGLGPIVQYNFTALNRPWFTKIKTGTVLYARNAGATDMVVLTIGTKF